MQEVKREPEASKAAPSLPKPEPRPTFGTVVRLALLKFPTRFLNGEFISRTALRRRFEGENPHLRKLLDDVERRVKTLEQSRRGAELGKTLELRRRVEVAEVVDRDQKQLREELATTPVTDRQLFLQRIKDNNLQEIMAGLTPEERKKLLEALNAPEPESGPAI